MLLEIDATNRIAERAALRAMFEARKRVFVDLLKWELPVLDDRYEIDQFDDDHAIYLVVVDDEHRHLASARLLPTTRPGILSGLFPDLCEAGLPTGPDIYEITRFCLSREIGAGRRRAARDMLVSALARYALSHGITRYTGVAEEGWLQQILMFGWHCSRLGAIATHRSGRLGALSITIGADTIARLRAGGVYAEPELAIAYTQAA